jgi:hypothetical protein
MTPGGAGLYLRVAPSGSKQWVQRITIHGKRRAAAFREAVARAEAAIRRHLAGRIRLGPSPLTPQVALSRLRAMAEAGTPRRPSSWRRWSGHWKAP